MITFALTPPLRLIAATVAATFALTACASTLDIPEVEQSPFQGPALLEEHAQRIVDETHDSLATLNEIPDPDAAPAENAGAEETDAASIDELYPRLSSNALAIQSASYAVAVAGKTEPREVPTEMLALYVSASDSWPRMLVGVTAQDGTDGTPVVMLWVQAEVTAPYELVSWAHMLPGAVLPAMPSQRLGAAELPADANSLVKSPAEIVAAYGDLLSADEAPESLAPFTEDAYFDQIHAARAALNATAKKAKGTYKDAVSVDVDNIYSIQSAEGGALVFASVTITSVFNAPNRQLSLPKADKVLLGDEPVKDTLVHTYSDMVVFYIPSTEVGGTVSVVAADHHLIGISARVE